MDKLKKYCVLWHNNIIDTGGDFWVTAIDIVQAQHNIDHYIRAILNMHPDDVEYTFMDEEEIAGYNDEYHD